MKLLILFLEVDRFVSVVRYGPMSTGGAGLPVFKWEDLDDGKNPPAKLVAPLTEWRSSRGSAACGASPHSRLRCIFWTPLGTFVILKEVHRWAEDTISSSGSEVSRHVATLQVRVAAAERFQGAEEDDASSSSSDASRIAKYFAFRHDTADLSYSCLMECSGPSLYCLLVRTTADGSRYLDMRRSRRLLRDVICGLDQLHRQANYVHGDVSLQNVLTRIDDESSAVLGDLDSARPIGGVPPCAAESFLYSPPERLRNGDVPLHPSSDIWAFGIIFYQVLTGMVKSHPLVSDGDGSGIYANFWAFLNLVELHQSRSIMEMLRRDVRLQKVPLDAVEVVGACLAWNPEERPSAAALLQVRWFRCKADDE